MGLMIGIYKITNKINGHSYIGQSVNIDKRIYAHKYSAQCPQAHDYNTSIHQAMRKYGLENFEVEVLETLPEDKTLLNQREIYWIQFYNTYLDGYNETIGGERGNMQHEETHNRAKLTREDVIDIRQRYANLERCAEVYEQYKDKIGRSGFNKIWKGETWPSVMPEVFTPERAEYHQLHTSNPGERNGRSLLTDAEVLELRRAYRQGASIKDLYEKYKDRGITYGSFGNTVRGYNRKYLNNLL